MDRADYRLHGVALRTAAPPEVTRLLYQRLARFHTVETSKVDLDFTFGRGSVFANHFASPGRRVYELEGGCVTYDPESKVLSALYRDLVQMTCDTASGETVYKVAPDADADRLATQILFTLPLIELMRQRMLFNVHAAGLCREGKTVLLAGRSGAGKSTLTLALTQGGWAYMGDDMLFLQPDGRTLLGFPQGISYTPDTTRLVRGLPDAPDGSRKGHVWPDRVFGSEEVLSAEADALVFPRIAAARQSILSPITSSEAFLELASNVLMTDQGVCEAHFGSLAQLTKQVPSYRLNTGWDLMSALEVIEELLQRFL